VNQAAREAAVSLYRLIGLEVPEQDLPVLTEMLERHLEAFRVVEQMEDEPVPSLTFKADWE
jgi:hypothetical protein